MVHDIFSVELLDDSNASSNDLISQSSNGQAEGFHFNDGNTINHFNADMTYSGSHQKFGETVFKKDMAGVTEERVIKHGNEVSRYDADGAYAGKSVTLGDRIVHYDANGAYSGVTNASNQNFDAKGSLVSSFKSIF